MNKIFQTLLAPLLLLIIVIFFFSPFLLEGTIPYVGDFTGSDLTELNLPLRYFAGESLSQGKIPLWSDLLAGGFPVLAEGQAGVFYPFNLILFTLLPFVWAVNLMFLLNFFFAGFFTYLYARVIKLSLFASLLSAIAFSFSGFFIFRLKHINLINSAIWLPLQFYLVERYFKTKSKGLVGLAFSAVLAIQFFAGHPQIFYISVVSSFVYFLLRGFSLGQFKVSNIHSRVVFPWVSLGVIVFGLTAVQLLPTFFYSFFSGRSLAVSYAGVIDFAYRLPDLLSLVSPYAFGNPSFYTFPADIHAYGVFWENNIYFGILSFVLAMVGIIFMSVRDKVAKTLTILLGSSFLLIFGDLSPVFIIFWETLPGFQMFRFPQRFLLLSLLAFAILAGFGFDFAWAKIKNYLEKFRFLLKSKILLQSLLPLLIVMIVAVDLFFVAFKYVGMLDYEKYFSPTKTASFLQEDIEDFRIHSYKWPLVWSSANHLSGGWQNNLSFFISQRELIPPNLNVFWDIPSAQDRASLEGGMLNQEMHVLGDAIRTKFWTSVDDENNATINDSVLRVLGIQNVKYILSFENLDNENLIIVKEVREDFYPELKVYQNAFFQPFAYGVPQVHEATTTDDMLYDIFEKEYDFSQSVVVQEDVLSVNQNNVIDFTSNVEVTKGINGSKVIEVDFSHDGYLYLSQVFMSGWKVYVDDVQSDILRANFAFSAIPIRAGNHEVFLTYRPVSYLIGAWISIVSLIFVLSLAFYLLNRKQK